MNVEKLTWYAARSGGIVAWCLLALGIILGLVLSSRILGRRVSPAWILSVHRYLGGLSVVFTAVHVAAIMLDDFVDFGLQAVLVPWASSWRPGAVAWGIVAMYLMVAIEITSFAMRRLPKRLWRAVHWSSGPLFVAATIHGYQAGTDVGRAFVVATVGVIACLVVLTAVRVARARRADESAVPRSDPRELLDRAKGRPAMRASAPDHVLDGLTLATRPAMTGAPQPGSQPPPAATPQEPETQPAPEPVGVGAAARSDAAKRPATLEDALPRVPDSPCVGDLAAARGQEEAGAAFFDALAAVPATPAKPEPVTAAPPPPPPPPAPPAPLPQKRRVSVGTSPAPGLPRQQPAQQSVAPGPTRPPSAPRSEARTPAPTAPPPPKTRRPHPTTSTSPIAAPPRPAWGEPGADGASPSNVERRPGPAPGVWKRSPPRPPADAG